MTRRRWFPTISAREGEDLDAKIAVQDTVARDSGYVKISQSPVRTVGDVRAVELVYEEAPESSEVAQRAAALGNREDRRMIGFVLFVAFLFVLGAASIIGSGGRWP